MDAGGSEEITAYSLQTELAGRTGIDGTDSNSHNRSWTHWESSFG
jgi:hypothetical protein